MIYFPGGGYERPSQVIQPAPQQAQAVSSAKWATDNFTLASPSQILNLSQAVSDAESIRVFHLSMNIPLFSLVSYRLADNSIQLIGEIQNRSRSGDLIQVNYLTQN